jgi:HTH-type transcriptional regulator / antitoxin HigA
MRIDLNTIKINPVSTPAEFEEAIKYIDALVDADLWEDPVERKKALDILEAISILATAYEKRYHAIPQPDPISAIKERMEQLNLTQKDVATYFGGENRVSEVLSGKRKLTVNMMRALHRHLHIPAETLLRTRG